MIPLAIAFSAAAAGAFTLGRLGVRLHRLSQSARLGVSFVALSLPRWRCTRRCMPTRPRPRNASSSTSTRRRRRVSATTSSGGCSGPSNRLTRCPRWLSSCSGSLRNADHRSRVRRLVEHRPRALPPDLGHRAVRCRRPARQFVRASPARVRDRSLHGVRLRQLGQPFDEISPFGSSERHVLRTSRGICQNGRLVGSIVVRVMLDYRTLPFISSQSPYLESLRPNRRRRRKASRAATSSSPSMGGAGRRCSRRAPASGRSPTRSSSAWSESREPFWATVDARRRPLPRLLPHRSRRHLRARLSGRHLVRPLVNLAELVMLTGVLYVVLLVGADAVQRVTLARAGQRPRAAPRDPVQLLPQAVPAVRGRRRRAGGHPRLATRDLLRRAAARRRRRSGGADRDDRAAPGRGLRGAAAARRPAALGARRRSDHGARRAAPSTRTSTCSTRAPSGDERARPLRVAAAADADAGAASTERIVLDRLPTFVGDEDFGAVGYRLAAAPVRAGGRDGIVTVPLTQPAAGNRAADRRARSAGPLGDRAVQPARRGARLLDGRTDRGSGQPADARDAPHRPRRPRRAGRGHVVATNCGGSSRTSTRWRPT